MNKSNKSNQTTVDLPAFFKKWAEYYVDEESVITMVIRPSTRLLERRIRPTLPGRATHANQLVIPPWLVTKLERLGPPDSFFLEFVENQGTNAGGRLLPVQTAAMPLVTRGYDVLLCGPPKSGKTFSCLLPLLSFIGLKRGGGVDKEEGSEAQMGSTGVQVWSGAASEGAASDASLSSDCPTAWGTLSEGGRQRRNSSFFSQTSSPEWEVMTASSSQRTNSPDWSASFSSLKSTSNGRSSEPVAGSTETYDPMASSSSCCSSSCCSSESIITESSLCGTFRPIVVVLAPSRDRVVQLSRLIAWFLSTHNDMDENNTTSTQVHNNDTIKPLVETSTLEMLYETCWSGQKSIPIFNWCFTNHGAVISNNLVVSTPSNLLALLIRPNRTTGVDLSQVRAFMVDHAEKMVQRCLTMKILELEKLMTARPRQTLMTSLLDRGEIRDFARFTSVRTKILLEVSMPPEMCRASHELILLSNENERLHLLYHELAVSAGRAVVFCETQQGCELLYLALVPFCEIKVALLTPQTEVDDNFANCCTNVFIMTDGIPGYMDVPCIDLLVNYDMPRDAEVYRDRIQRLDLWPTKVVTFILPPHTLIRSSWEKSLSDICLVIRQLGQSPPIIKFL